MGTCAEGAINRRLIRVNLSTAVKESPVILSATKHLGPANEILRFAQDDKWRGSMLRLIQALKIGSYR